jgi:hypothetical protein
MRFQIRTWWPNCQATGALLWGELFAAFTNKTHCAMQIIAVNDNFDEVAIPHAPDRSPGKRFR